MSVFVVTISTPLHTCEIWFELSKLWNNGHKSFLKLVPRATRQLCWSGFLINLSVLAFYLNDCLISRRCSCRLREGRSCRLRRSLKVHPKFGDNCHFKCTIIYPVCPNTHRCVLIIENWQSRHFYFSVEVYLNHVELSMLICKHGFSQKKRRKKKIHMCVSITCVGSK